MRLARGVALSHSKRVLGWSPQPSLSSTWKPATYPRWMPRRVIYLIVVGSTACCCSTINSCRKFTAPHITYSGAWIHRSVPVVCARRGHSEPQATILNDTKVLTQGAQVYWGGEYGPISGNIILNIGWVLAPAIGPMEFLQHRQMSAQYWQLIKLRYHSDIGTMFHQYHFLILVQSGIYKLGQYSLRIISPAWHFDDESITQRYKFSLAYDVRLIFQANTTHPARRQLQKDNGVPYTTSLPTLIYNRSLLCNSHNVPVYTTCDCFAM